jgi:hypothetical protein
VQEHVCHKQQAGDAGTAPGWDVGRAHVLQELARIGNPNVRPVGQQVDTIWLDIQEVQRSLALRTEVQQHSRNTSLTEGRDVTAECSGCVRIKVEGRIDTLLDQRQANEVKPIFSTAMPYGRPASLKCTAGGKIAVDPRHALECWEVAATPILVQRSTSAQLRFDFRQNVRQSRKSQRNRDRTMDRGKS